jgi:hypothetical protein
MVGIRIDESDYNILKERADAKELTVSAYIKQRIVDSIHTVNKVVNTMVEAPYVDNQVKVVQNPYQVTPIFNPRVHKTGDKVRKWDGGKWVECIVPQVDADGYVEFEQ